MTERRPRIGITTGARPSWLEGAPEYEGYARAVREAGGDPVRLPPRSIEEFHRVARGALWALDGLLLAGGRDVDLRLYPNPPAFDEEVEAVMERRRMRLEPERDRLELPLIEAALRADRPILGICRGCQVLHVALGGHLILDIPSERPQAREHRTHAGGEAASVHHPIHITEDSLLARAAGLHGRHETNTRHHQAVLPRTSDRIRVIATSAEDDLVEALEVPEARWAVGVQWHPEHPADPAVRDRFRPLFEAFVRAARGR